MREFFRGLGELLGYPQRSVQVSPKEQADINAEWKRFLNAATFTAAPDDEELTSTVATDKWAKELYKIWGPTNLTYALVNARKIERCIPETKDILVREVAACCVRDLSERAKAANSKMEILDVLDPVHKAAVAVKKGSRGERDLVSIWAGLKNSLLGHSPDAVRLELAHVIEVTPKDRLIYRQAARAQRQAARQATA